MTSDEGSSFKVKVLISKDVDAIIEQIVDYILRDYLYSWATEFVPDDANFKQSLTDKIKNEIWLVLRKLISRLQDIDAVIFITETLPRILQKHFEKFNLASSQQVDENQHLVQFMLAEHLKDDNTEIEFLRKVSEYLLRILLPNNYATCDEFVLLIREVLANHVFFNVIDFICDPYFINHQAIIYGAIVGPVTSSLNIETFPDEGLFISQENLPFHQEATQQGSIINQKSELPHIEKHISKTKAKIDEFKHKLSQKINEIQSSDDGSLNSNAPNIDVDQLRSELHDLEGHLTRAQLWELNIGAWLVEVHCVERWTETDEMLVLFLVYADKSKTGAPGRTSSTGWVTIRSLAEVCDQKRRLSKKIPALRKLDHPIFRRNDKGQSATAQSVWKKELQQFFDLLIGSQELRDNEEVFLFLSPTPKNIVARISNVQPNATSKLSKLPFLPYFGVSPILLNNQKNVSTKHRGSLSQGSSQASIDLQSQRPSYSNQSYYNGFNIATNNHSATPIVNDEEESKEDISEAMYGLVSEIFELKKAHNWLRRTIILFFQVAFGKTINKQIKDTVSQITSDTFIAEQLTKFKDSFWPNGDLAEASPTISEDDMKLTYLLAKQYLINNIPDAFSNLIGQQNARKGFLKVFEALQNKKANKQLFYVSICANDVDNMFYLQRKKLDTS